MERAFEQRPDVYAAWRGLVGAVTANMDLRRYELATFAAAQRLRSTYCSIMHGNVLRNQLGEDVLALVDDREAHLDPVDLAVMDFAERVVVDATSITENDLQRLRDLGLGDAEIMDVALAAAMRCFFSKTLDALCVQADAQFQELEPDLKEALVVGRPIATSETG
jgi:alkylhydroperoxidase family enzyme